MAPRDLERVLRSVPRDILMQLMSHPGELFLAGGALRDIIRGEAPSDYDLFGSETLDLKALAMRFAILHGTELLESPNAFTIAPEGRTPIQIITKWRYDSPEQLAKEFDFTVAKVIVYYTRGQLAVHDMPGQPAGWLGLVDPDFYSDLAAKRLVYTGGGTPGGTLLRMVKLLRRGFTIQVESLATLVSRVVQEAELKRTSADQDQETLLREILREVDPLPAVVRGRAA